MSVVQHTAHDVHPLGCDCSCCEPWRNHELNRLTDGEAITLACLAVFVLTIAAIELVATIAGLPHVTVMIGGRG